MGQYNSPHLVMPAAVPEVLWENSRSSSMVGVGLAGLFIRLCSSLTPCSSLPIDVIDDNGKERQRLSARRQQEQYQDTYFTTTKIPHLGDNHKTRNTT